jgi:HNH endonuclease
MFDPGVIHQIEGTNIDRPYNALTLTHDFHQRFGDLNIYFEPVPNSGASHTYVIKQTTSYPFFRRQLPLTRTLFTTHGRTIDPPSSRLLAIHRACSLILHLSGAAEFVSKVIRDMDENAVESDGTTELGSLVSLGLREWDGSVRVY